jgi:hypothetical protein
VLLLVELEVLDVELEVDVLDVVVRLVLVELDVEVLVVLVVDDVVVVVLIGAGAHAASTCVFRFTVADGVQLIVAVPAVAFGWVLLATRLLVAMVSKRSLWEAPGVKLLTASPPARQSNTHALADRVVMLVEIVVPEPTAWLVVASGVACAAPVTKTTPAVISVDPVEVIETA